ncbi:unnamed protein product, partial [Brassica oleracea]
FWKSYTHDATIVMNNVRMDRDLGFLERLTGSDFGLRLENDDRIKSSMLNNAIFDSKSKTKFDIKKICRRDVLTAKYQNFNINRKE